MEITFYGLHTDQKIRAIKFLRQLAPIHAYEATLGLKAAKDVADKLQTNEIEFKFYCDPAYADIVESHANMLGFTTSRSIVREVRMDSLVTYPQPETVDLEPDAFTNYG